MPRGRGRDGSPRIDPRGGSCRPARAMTIRRGFFLSLILAVCTSVLAAASQAAPRKDGHGRAPLDEYNRALGVECSHCHVPDQWQDDSKPAKATARKMVEMVPLLNA